MGSLSSSHHVDHVHTRSVGCAHGEHDLHDARTNSCLGTHAARVNSFGLHSARGSSGGHSNSYRCTYYSCGGVRGRNKADEYEYSVPGQVSCCREACFFAAGTRNVACRDVGRTRWEPQPADFQGGGNHAGVCGHGDPPSPSSLLFRVTWAWQRS